MKYSNSFIEAIRAKFSFGWRVKIIVRRPFLTDKFALFSWTDGLYLYDFYSNNRWHLFPIYRGEIRKRSYSSYIHWKNTNNWID